MPISLIQPAISLSGYHLSAMRTHFPVSSLYPYQCHKGVFVRLFALLLLTGRLLASCHAHSRVVIHTGHYAALLRRGSVVAVSKRCLVIVSAQQARNQMGLISRGRCQGDGRPEERLGSE